jgi:hypothetical protein
MCSRKEKCLVDALRNRNRNRGPTGSQPRPGKSRRLAVLGFLAMAGFWLVLEPALLLASITDPILFLQDARASSGSTRSSVQLTGNFPEAALVQIAYPLQVLIYDANDFYVRYDLPNGASQGSSVLLQGGGLTPSEAISLSSEAGTPAPDAQVLFVGAGRIEVLLPTSFPIGDAQALLLFVDAGGGVVSNPLSFVIPAHVPLPSLGATR